MGIAIVPKQSSNENADAIVSSQRLITIASYMQCSVLSTIALTLRETAVSKDTPQSEMKATCQIRTDDRRFTKPVLYQLS